MVFVPNIVLGSEVPCSGYNLPSYLKCEGWDPVLYILERWADADTQEQITSIQMFKSEWAGKKYDSQATDVALQASINNCLNNVDARNAAQLDDSLLVMNKPANENRVKALKTIQGLREKGVSYDDIFSFFNKGPQPCLTSEDDSAKSLIARITPKEKAPYGRFFVKAKNILGNNILSDFLRNANPYAILGPR